ncbi:MAG: DUF535 domain-containing protein [Rubrivivax sp.]|nr:MAG: DUF535 domain-containing protein [Rubrivivax sp.]
MPSSATLTDVSKHMVDATQASGTGVRKNPLLAPYLFVKKELAAKRGLGIVNTCFRMLSVLAHPGQHWQVMQAIGGAHTKGLLKAYPRAVYRYTLPYLSMNFDRAERQRLLKGHYDFLNTALSASFYERVMDDAMVLWEQEIQGNLFSISVSGPCMHREGDLTLVFKMDGCAVYRIAFSLVASPLLKLNPQFQQNISRHIVYVGQVQGYPGGFEHLRQATKQCRDVAPADLLMAAVAGLAGALGITMVAGVGYENSLSYQNLLKLKSNFSYADFWEKHHGIRSEGGHYILQVPLAEKPIQQVKANHRGRTLLKRELKKQVTDEAERVMRPLVLKRA